MIDSVARDMPDNRRYSIPFGLDIWLDGITYEAEVTIKSDKAYSIDSKDGDYEEDIPQTAEVGLESLVFPCTKFSVNNGIATFECVDPVELPTQPMSIGQVEDILLEAGIKTISRAVLKITVGSRTAIVRAVGCEDHVIHWS